MRARPHLAIKMLSSWKTF